MAVITINIGGVPTPIDIPDFAMEATLQDLVATSKQQLASLNKISGYEAQQTQVDAGSKHVAREVDRSNKESAKMTSKSLQQSFNDLKKNTTDQESLSDLVNQATSSLGGVVNSMPGALGNILGGMSAAAGGALGFTISALEKFGAALSYTQRVGIGLSTSLHDVRNAASTMGVTLDDFGRLMIQNGTAVRALSSNMETGYQRAAQLSEEFRRQTINVGHFGMSTGEMNEMLLEEIEMRRVTMGQQAVATMSLQELAASAAENRMQQMALARLTGQDVRERMAAQQALQSNAIAQEYLTGASEETREKMLALGSALSSVPGGERIQDALIASIATGVDPRAFEAELFTYLGPQAQGLIDFIQTNLEGGMSSGEFARDIQRVTSGLAEGGGQLGGSLSILAAFGDETANQVLAIRNQTVRIAESTEEFNREYNDALDTMLNTTALAVSGIENQYSTLMARLNARIMDFSAALFGGLDEQGAGGGLIETFAQLNDALDSEAARVAARGGGEVANVIATSVGNVIDELFTGGRISGAYQAALEQFGANGTLRVRVENINDLPISPRD